MKFCSCLALIAILAFTAVGCAESSPLSPSPAGVDLTGTWSGPAQDSYGGNGNLRATIAQFGSAFSGTWAITFPNPNNNNGGTVDGTVNGSKIAGTLRSNAVCPLSVTFLVNGNSMSGTYASINCSISITGSFTMAR